VIPHREARLPTKYQQTSRVTYKPDPTRISRDIEQLDDLEELKKLRIVLEARIETLAKKQNQSIRRGMIVHFSERGRTIEAEVVKVNGIIEMRDANGIIWRTDNPKSLTIGPAPKR
jgi:hypothetical protein